MTEKDQLIAVARLAGWKFGGPYKPHEWIYPEWISEITKKPMRGKGFICEKCGQHHLGERLVEAYCDCGINPEWVFQRVAFWTWEAWKHLGRFPQYLLSRDALMPVIVKWCDDNNQWDCFIENLWDVLKITSDWSEQDAWRELFKSPISKLVEALLRSAGTWKE